MKNQQPLPVKLTANFDLAEFDCKDGTPVPSSLLHNVNALAFQLQIIRDHVGCPLHINSGYRTNAWNRKQGGSPKSMHLVGKAADISCEGFTPKELADIIEDLIASDFIRQGGLGLYNNFLHYDIRGFKARWDYRTQH